MMFLTPRSLTSDGKHRKGFRRGVEIARQAGAEFFKTLGHPARVRILDLLADWERSVSELQPEVGPESSHL